MWALWTHYSRTCARTYIHTHTSQHWLWSNFNLVSQPVPHLTYPSYIRISSKRNTLADCPVTMMEHILARCTSTPTCIFIMDTASESVYLPVSTHNVNSTPLEEDLRSSRSSNCPYHIDFSWNTFQDANHRYTQVQTQATPTVSKIRT